MTIRNNKNIVLNLNKKSPAFTIVELLVVIVVIGILAAITIVSYSGISNKAIDVSLQSDLDSSKKLLALYNVDYGYFPNTLGSNYCSETPTIDTHYCLKPSKGNTFSYAGSAQDYTLTATNTLSGRSFEITPNTTPTAVSGGDEVTSVTFATTWGGTDYDEGYSLVKTSDGGYAVAGTTESYDAGGGDMFLAKYDSSSNLSWLKTWGGIEQDMGNSLVQTSDGGYAVAGTTESYGAGNSDMFIVKYDSLGNLSWSKTWGVALYDYSNSLVQTSDGGYAVTGSSIYNSQINNYDMFLVKYDSSGNLSWSKTWGGTGEDIGRSLVQTTDGGYAVTGSTYNSDINNYYDMFLAKYDSSGNLSWSKTWGGPNSDSGESLIQTTDGGYVVVGSSENSGYGDYDMFLAKYDSSGNLSWSKIWGGPGYDIGSSLVQTTDGGYTVAGYTQSYGNVNVDGDIFLAKYDSSGNLSWSKTWGGIGDEYVRSLVQTSDGGYVLTGQAEIYGAGNYDTLLLKYDSIGRIKNCPSPMCQDVTATTSVSTAIVGSPSAILGVPTVTVTSPSATITSPSTTMVDIIADSQNTLVPNKTIIFAAQEMYVAYPGEGQTVCKEWTVPTGKSIKGFFVSQETEYGYNYFTVSVDGVQKYKKSGDITDRYVSTSKTPGTILSACMVTDDAITQEGYGGQVTAVFYE